MQASDLCLEQLLAALCRPQCRVALLQTHLFRSVQTRALVLRAAQLAPELLLSPNHRLMFGVRGFELVLKVLSSALQQDLCSPEPVVSSRGRLQQRLALCLRLPHLALEPACTVLRRAQLRLRVGQPALQTCRDVCCRRNLGTPLFEPVFELATQSGGLGLLLGQLVIRAGKLSLPLLPLSLCLLHRSNRSSGSGRVSISLCFQNLVCLRNLCFCSLQGGFQRLNLSRQFLAPELGGVTANAEFCAIFLHRAEVAERCLQKSLRIRKILPQHISLFCGLAARLLGLLQLPSQVFCAAFESMLSFLLHLPCCNLRAQLPCQFHRTLFGNSLLLLGPSHGGLGSLAGSFGSRELGPKLLGIGHRGLPELGNCCLLLGGLLELQAGLPELGSQCLL
mmetsp:Transcript_84984/g.243900  ORF Transcript_84984/g.243900 Transcript_84984/m.243900 type:complete len:393 (+) Transcript_84984:170-1348(+)